MRKTVRRPCTRLFLFLYLFLSLSFGSITDDNPPSQGTGLDWRAVFAGVAPVAWFVGMAVLATLGGYPGVVCMTPMAWLIGLAAGQRVATVTRSAGPRRPLVEAAIAGAVVGVITVVMFVVVSARFELQDAEEVQQMLGLTACMTVGGVVVPAVLAVGMAWVVGRRRAREEGN